ncbi:MAG: formate dehydrogenase accessory sulfurtransferase FdhD, partial [Chitinispirillia bacterium]|jgi:FdhD protein
MVLRVKNNKYSTSVDSIATEIPFTIIVNDIEVATLLCSPIDLKELALGFLYTSGFIKSMGDFKSVILDTVNWTATVRTVDTPDLNAFQKRMYTSGCGKGIMYTSVNEIIYRHPIKNTINISAADIFSIALWLQKCSELYKKTGGIHTAALSIQGKIPVIHLDDIGRHNAVDKVIGRALSEKMDFAKCILICSGRMSSEILHKARVCQIPVIMSRGAPTHQTILKARDMGICVIGFARGTNFNVYAHDEAIIVQ